MVELVRYITMDHCQQFPMPRRELSLVSLDLFIPVGWSCYSIGLSHPAIFILFRLFSAFPRSVSTITWSLYLLCCSPDVSQSCCCSQPIGNVVRDVKHQPFHNDTRRLHCKLISTYIDILTFHAVYQVSPIMHGTEVLNFIGLSKLVDIVYSSGDDIT